MILFPIKVWEVCFKTEILLKRVFEKLLYTQKASYICYKAETSLVICLGIYSPCISIIPLPLPPLSFLHVKNYKYQKSLARGPAFYLSLHLTNTESNFSYSFIKIQNKAMHILSSHWI